MAKCKLTIHVEYSDTLSEEDIRQMVARAISQNVLVDSVTTLANMRQGEDDFDPEDFMSEFCG